MNLFEKNCINKIGCGGIPIQRAEQDTVNEMIDCMIKLNLNFIDSARGYTDSEEKLGIALNGKREKFIIATKSMARDYEGMLKDIHKSLVELNTNYIDLYQLHNVSLGEEYSGALKALKEAQSSGMIRHIGVTTHSLDFLNKAIESNEFETIQYPYNIVETQAEEAFKKAKQKNIGVIVMKPFAGGAIQDTNLALKFILKNDNVSVVIPGMETVQQIEENVKCSSENLKDEDYTKIKKIRESLKNDFCRRCGYCMPCSRGINIPLVFLCEGYYTRYGLKKWALDRYRAMKINEKTCIRCGKCEEKCPYGLKIISKLSAAIKILGE